MFSLFKKKNNLPSPPPWADFFSAKEYSQFSKSVSKYFSSKGIDYDVVNEVVRVSNNDFGFNQLGLTNVAQLCKLDGIERSDQIVNDHFEGLIKSHQYDQEFKKIVHAFDQVKHLIGVRLYNDNYLNQIGHDLVISEPVVNGIFAVLIFDLPHSVINVQPTQAEIWGHSVDELFEIGKENIRTNYKLDISREIFGDFNIWLLQSDHFYTPNILFNLDEKPELIGSKGSLIGVPHRHAALIYPIENLEVIKAINQLIPVIHGMYIEGPGSLSSKLYWSEDGKIHELPSEISEKGLRFMPPDNFVEMLNTLK